METAYGTATAFEAQRYQEVLREILATSRERLGIIAEFSNGETYVARRPDDDRENDRLLGWVDTEMVYLLPAKARRAVDDLLGHDGALKVSNHALHKQLDSMGVIAPRDPGHYTKNRHIPGLGPQKTLWLKKAALFPDDETTAKEATAEKMPGKDGKVIRLDYRRRAKPQVKGNAQ